jgi:signal transduction histidine kinase
LHDCLAQDLVAIGFQLDLLGKTLPSQYRTELRQIRSAVTDATCKVRKELFALRDTESDYQAQLIRSASPLNLQINGNPETLSSSEKGFFQEIVKNASDHSKGHNIKIDLSAHQISIQDDGQGFYGVSELVWELGGEMSITSTRNGTKVEICLP